MGWWDSLSIDFTLIARRDCFLIIRLPWCRQEAFDAQSFVSRLLGLGDMKGFVQQLRESQEGSGDPKEMM